MQGSWITPSATQSILKEATPLEGNLEHSHGFGAVNF